MTDIAAVPKRKFAIPRLDSKIMTIVALGATVTVLAGVLLAQWKYASLGRKVDRITIGFLTHTGSVRSNGSIEGGHVKTRLPVHAAVLSTIAHALEFVDSRSTQPGQSPQQPGQSPQQPGQPPQQQGDVAPYGMPTYATQPGQTAGQAPNGSIYDSNPGAQGVQPMPTGPNVQQPTVMPPEVLQQPVYQVADYGGYGSQQQSGMTGTGTNGNYVASDYNPNEFAPNTNGKTPPAQQFPDPVIKGNQQFDLNAGMEIPPIHNPGGMMY